MHLDGKQAENVPNVLFSTHKYGARLSVMWLAA